MEKFLIKEETVFAEKPAGKMILPEEMKKVYEIENMTLHFTCANCPEVLEMKLTKEQTENFLKFHSNHEMNALKSPRVI